MDVLENGELYIKAATGVALLCLLAVCFGWLRSPPKSIFQKPTNHVEIKAFRKTGKK